MLEHWAQGLEFGCKVEGCIRERIFQYVPLFCLFCIINIVTSLTSIGICVAMGMIFVTGVQIPHTMLRVRSLYFKNLFVIFNC